MNHDHEGPLDVACEGCFLELQQEQDEESRRVWRGILWVYLILSVIFSVLMVAMMECGR